MLTTNLHKKFKPLSPHILKIYIWKKFTISQALSGSLVICPSSGGYLPFDEYTRLFHWVITISIPKRKSSNCKKNIPNRAVFYILIWCVRIRVEVEIPMLHDSMFPQRETVSAVHLRRSSGSPLNARMVELICLDSFNSFCSFLLHPKRHTSQSKSFLLPQ